MSLDNHLNLDIWGEGWAGDKTLGVVIIYRYMVSKTQGVYIKKRTKN